MWVFFDDFSLHNACYYLIKRKKVVVRFLVCMVRYAEPA
jgi:hypothetical protein